jgi:hypothetical protein
MASAQGSPTAKDRLMTELRECDQKARIDASEGGQKTYAQWSQCCWSKKLDFFGKDPDAAPYMDIFRNWAASELEVWEKVDRHEIKLENVENILSALETIFEEALYERLTEIENAQRASWEMKEDLRKWGT